MMVLSTLAKPHFYRQMAMHDVDIKLKTVNSEHPAKPSEELVEKWMSKVCHELKPSASDLYISRVAAKWGWDKRGAAIEKEPQEARDQELEACCEWLISHGWFGSSNHDAIRGLRAARRPKSLSLKEQKQAELDRLITLISKEGTLAMAEPIRQALEKLKTLEQLDD